MQYICATEGNVSAKIDRDKIIITPKGKNKGFITTKDLIWVGKDGRKIKGKWEPSIETKMHLEIYKSRKDVGATVHAHPPFVVALSLSGKKLNISQLPEISYFYKKVPVVRFLKFGSRQLAVEVARKLKKNNVAILARHGVVAVGKNLQEAFDNLQRLEWAAKTIIISKILKCVR